MTNCLDRGTLTLPGLALEFSSSDLAKSEYFKCMIKYERKDLQLVPMRFASQRFGPDDLEPSLEPKRHQNESKWEHTSRCVAFALQSHRASALQGFLPEDSRLFRNNKCVKKKVAGKS